jgi:hypothetical protein
VLLVLSSYIQEALVFVLLAEFLRWEPEAAAAAVQGSCSNKLVSLPLDLDLRAFFSVGVVEASIWLFFFSHQ